MTTPVLKPRVPATGPTPLGRAIRRSRLSVAVACLSLLGSMAPGAASEAEWEVGGEHLGALTRFGWHEGFGCHHCRMLAETAEAQSAEDLRWWPVTGMDRRNYPPDRRADIKHIHLRIDIPDMNEPRFRAMARVIFEPVGRPLDVLTLNAEQLGIVRVDRPNNIHLMSNESGTVGRQRLEALLDQPPVTSDTPWPAALRGNASELPFTHDGSRLTVRFDPPLLPGENAEVDIWYEVTDPPDGLFWTPESPDWPGRAAQIHTQGQPETNRYWFPSHDFPNDRLTTSLDVTVPEGFMVSSNGRLEKSQTVNGRTGFKWVQDKEHVVYLVSLIVGKFDERDVAPAGHRVPMPVWVPPGRGRDVEQTYGRTARMMEVFEDRFGHPYPWDRYAQLVVHNFGAGGMENTAATTMYDTAIFDAKALLDGDLDGLIAHELGHQWFGDLITCNSWEHIWLNEGFATYSTSLWYEARDGVNGYLSNIYGNIRGLAGSDQLAPLADGKSDANPRPPMVSKVYRQPFETFRRVSNPYPKGASILHMLRRKLGDELFFRGLGIYVERYQNKTVETDDLRRVFEEISGLGLEQFFDQWCRRPGTPDVLVTASWDEPRQELRLVVEQRQRIDADHPAFVFDLPVEVQTASGGEGPLTLVIPVTERRHERTIALAAAPHCVLIDPDLHVLMKLDLQAPVDWLYAQSFSDRSIASRLDAVTWLRRHPGKRTEDLLRRLTLAGPEHHIVRARAAESLGHLRAEAALLEALNAGVDDARARIAVIRSLGRTGGPDAVEALARHAAMDDESYACREAAVAALGRHGNAAHLPIILAALDVESQHDQVRQGALRALRDLDDARGLEHAIRFTKPGWPSRLRPVAIETVAQLAHHDPVKAADAILPLLQDRERRPVRAAAAALVDMQEPRGLESLDRLIATTRSDELRRQATGWRESLANATAKADANDPSRRHLERLERELELLRQEIEKR